MDHNFVASQLNTDQCARCKYNQRAHTNFAQCETCPTIGPCEIFTGMLMCKKCIELEMIAVREHQTVDKQEARLEESKTQQLLSEAKRIDQSIELDIDIFNAKTTALIEILNQIDVDESVPADKKALTKAEYAHSRILHLRSVIFDLKRQVDEAHNEQRAAQVYLNKVANELRADERERLKIEDITYQPTPRKQPKPKTASVVKKQQSAKKDVEDSNLWAAKIGMPGTLILMRMKQKNMSAEEATRTFAKEMNIAIKD